MQRFSFLIVSLLIVNILTAQNIIFNWQSCLSGYESEEFDVFPYDIAKTDDGFLMVADYEVPTTAPPPQTDSDDIWLVKLDNDGNFVWDKFLGGGDRDMPCMIEASTDGYYYIIGGSTSSDGDITYDPYPNSGDYWVIKIDANGNKIWDKIIGGTSGEYMYNSSVYADADGGITFIGTTLSHDGDITQNFGAYDMWMVKLNADGTKAWDFTAGTLDFEFSEAMIHTSDGGYLLGGDGTSVAGGNITCISPSWSKPEAILLKLDSERNIEWQQCIGGSEYDGVGELLEISGGYLIGLWSSSDDRDFANSGYHIGYDNVGHRTEDMVLRKTDYSGNVIWQRCYGGSKNESPLKFFNLSDGNFMVFARTASKDGDVVGLHYDPSYPQYTLRDIWMLKINSTTGDIIWQRCIGTDDDDDIFIEGIIQLSDRDYVMTIQAFYYLLGDIACSPAQTNKQYAWTISLTDTVTYTGTQDNQAFNEVVHIYPNPASDFITIEIPKHLCTGNTVLEIINCEGTKVKKIELNDEIPILQISDLPAGLYILKLTNQRMKASKRFMKI